MNMKHNFIIGNLNSGTFVVFVLSEMLTVLVRGSSLDRDRSPTMIRTSSSYVAQLFQISQIRSSPQLAQDRKGGASGCGYTILIGACAVLYHWTIASIY